MKLLETQEEFDKMVKESDGKLVVIDFFATWCGPCRMIGPKFDKLADKFSDALFAKVDIDETGMSDIVDDEDVSVMPTFVLYKNGTRVVKLEGNVPDKLEAAIQEHK